MLGKQRLGFLVNKISSFDQELICRSTKQRYIKSLHLWKKSALSGCIYLLAQACLTKMLLLSNTSMLGNLPPLAGQVKFHPQSGSRSSLVLRDEPEDTSFWVEERNGEIIYYKNYATDGYLGECYKTFLLTTYLYRLFPQPWWALTILYLL